jgi:hypothetical protein
MACPMSKNGTNLGLRPLGVKIEPANKVQIYFSERDAFSARKTSLFIYLSLH